MDIRQFTKHDEFSDGLHLEENLEKYKKKTTTRNITLHFKFLLVDT